MRVLSWDLEGFTESRTEPSADNSASRFSFFEIRAGRERCESPFGTGPWDVGPDSTVGAWMSSILRPIRGKSGENSGND